MSVDPQQPPVGDGVPGQPYPMQPAAPIPTENQRLSDGVNRCPRCGSSEVAPRPETGTLICLFCRYEWTEANAEQTFGLDTPIDQLVGTVLTSGAADIDRNASAVLTMKCSGCGAEVVVNTADAMSARCHWCRHMLTVNEQIPNGAVPDAVLPFALTHDQAVTRIGEFAGRRKFFADSRFKREFTPENVVGVYMPYMVVDGNATSELRGVGEVKTREYTRGSGDDKKTYYDADVYRVDRKLDFTVDDLTIESSAERANMDTRVNTNNIINTILPFDTKNAVVWNAGYLTGFTSEKRDQDVSQLVPTLENQLLSIARSRAQGSVRAYDRGVRWEAERLDVHGTRWVAMYLPVWLYSYYDANGGEGLVHYIAVNGRSGETMGSIPIAKGRLVLAALAIGSVLEILVLLILGVALL